MEKVKTFFESPTSNLVGIALGGALLGLNLLEFSIVGIFAGTFLLIAEGLQYMSRK